MGERSSDETSRRLWIAVGCAVALLIGLGMAYWQWSRYESASGTLQNLGYVLQWPLFGFFPVFMVWRIYLVAKRERGIEETPQAAEPASAPVVEATPQPKRSWMAYVPPTAEDAAVGGTADESDGDDAALTRYNAMLADLNAADDENSVAGDEDAGGDTTDDENTAEGRPVDGESVGQQNREHQNVR